MPCLATIGAQAQEFGWRWAMLSVVITLVVLWTLATLVYQGGRLTVSGEDAMLQQVLTLQKRATASRCRRR